MSDYKAIAAATAVIRSILSSQEGKVAGSSVEISSPAALKDSRAPILNLFLYQVTPNAALNSFDLPTRNHRGQLIAKPSLALDLHYLLTASSSDALEAQLMMANAMIALHDNAIVADKGQIQAAIELEKLLRDSNFAGQVESLKISLQMLSLEELTKLWSSFFQMDYRLSVAYKVSMVLLESDLVPMPSLPVSKRQIQVVSLKRPFIEKIEPQILAYDSPKKLVIRGRNLDSDKVLVRLGGREIEVTDRACVSGNQLSLMVPEGLLAGVKQVQVLQRILFDPHDTLGHKLSESNIATFTLTPVLKSIAPVVLNSMGELTLTFEPVVAANQKITLLIGKYVVAVEAPEEAVSQLKVKLPPHIPAGVYTVCLRIDNADSPQEDKQITINK